MEYLSLMKIGTIMLQLLFRFHRFILPKRINYVHRMALYKMHTQIKQQCSAFLRGFHSIVPPSWLACFTPRELQRVISGDDVELDVNDLR